MHNRNGLYCRFIAGEDLGFESRLSVISAYVCIIHKLLLSCSCLSKLMTLIVIYIKLVLTLVNYNTTRYRIIVNMVETNCCYLSLI